ncbi:MAG: hypothetical protein ACJZZ7_03375 [Cytophagales bacterium]
MRDPEVRPRLLKDIREQLDEQPPEGILMVGFKTSAMSRKYLAKTVAEAAAMRGQTPEEAIVDMVIEDDHRIQCIYFSMSEDNIRKKIQLPWVSFCSDAGSYSDVFLRNSGRTPEPLVALSESLESTQETRASSP